ncbi:MAG TPA: RNA polymerase sigma factor [Gaiellaceae bacterium]|nr:RNA polymerase sigma factor [Gaiellaceae bacterium]
MTDAEAIRRSREDAELFRPVFERHYDPIWRYLRRRLGADLADDLASETFVLAFRARRRYEPRGESALPWLYGIAANLVARHHRSETRRLRAYAALGALPADELDTESLLGRLAAAERGRSLAEALAALRRADRETLLLSAIGGLTHEQVGEALGVAAGTVAARLHRMRPALVAAMTSTSMGALS